MKNIKLVFTILMVSACVFCYAPIHDKPEGAKYYRELTDAERTKIQGGEAVANPNGEISEPKASAPAIRNDATASDTIAQALNDNAGKALAVANEDVEKGKGGGPRYLLWGGIVAALGLGAVFALKSYANKVVPEQKPTTKVRW